jgi:ketosteroid isomerase-like protein
MSEENVEVVRKHLKSFEDDVETWLDTFDPGVRVYPVEEYHAPVLGRQAALRSRERWLETWDPETYHCEIEELEGRGGDDVVSAVHITVRGRSSGAEVDVRVWSHWKLRNGKIVYCYEYATRAEALEAAGLGE